MTLPSNGLSGYCAFPLAPLSHSHSTNAYFKYWTSRYVRGLRQTVLRQSGNLLFADMDVIFRICETMKPAPIGRYLRNAGELGQIDPVGGLFEKTMRPTPFEVTASGIRFTHARRFARFRQKKRSPLFRISAQKLRTTDTPQSR